MPSVFSLPIRDRVFVVEYLLGVSLALRTEQLYDILVETHRLGQKARI